LFLGEDLLPLLLMALGGAMVVGTVMALLRPQDHPGEGELVRPPLARSVMMIAIGLVAVVWSLASLVS